MNILTSFRLTKVLYEQVLFTGMSIDSILRGWEPSDHSALVQYVTRCRGIVPKFVRMLAESVGVGPREVVREIMEARATGCEYQGDARESRNAGYIPEDNTDRFFYIQKLCGLSSKGAF
jgi:hypothetical protein